MPQRIAIVTGAAILDNSKKPKARAQAPAQLYTSKAMAGCEEGNPPPFR